MRKSIWLVASAIGLSITSLAYADDYPSRPLHLVVPYAPGGITDVATRMVAQALEEEINQTIVIENRPGPVCQT